MVVASRFPGEGFALWVSRERIGPGMTAADAACPVDQASVSGGVKNPGNQKRIGNSDGSIWSRRPAITPVILNHRRRHYSRFTFPVEAGAGVESYSMEKLWSSTGYVDLKLSISVVFEPPFGEPCVKEPTATELVQLPEVVAPVRPLLK